MSEKPIADGQSTTPPAGDGQASGLGADNAAGGTGAGVAGQFTQADMDKVVTDRLAREKRSLEAAHAKTLAERDAELQKYRDAEAAQQAAAMSELEKAQKVASDAQAETARLQTQVADANIQTLRANLLAVEAPDLPSEFRVQVTGADEEAIKASIAEARMKYQERQKAWLADVASLTPEQLVAKYGEEARPLAERLSGKVLSIGSPTAATPGQPPLAGEWDPNKPATQTTANWRKERERQGVGRVTIG